MEKEQLSGSVSVRDEEVLACAQLKLLQHKYSNVNN